MYEHRTCVSEARKRKRKDKTHVQLLVHASRVKNENKGETHVRLLVRAFQGVQVGGNMELVGRYGGSLVRYRCRWVAGLIRVLS